MEIQQKEKQQAFHQLLKGIEVEEYNLVLVTHDMSDRMFDFVESNRKVFEETMGWVSNFLTRKDSKDLLDAWQKGYEQENKLCYFIEYNNQNQNKQTIGFICFRTLDLIKGEAEIGYSMSGDFCNKGILRKCLIKLLQYSFDNLLLNQVTLVTTTDNIRSINVGNKLGFNILSTEKEVFNIKGVMKDIVTMYLNKQLFISYHSKQQHSS